MNIKQIKTISCVCLSAYLLIAYCPVHGQNIDDPSSFGFVSQSLNGTVSSSATVSGMNLQNVSMWNWAPPQGSIVYVENELNHKAKLMENREEIRNG